MLCPPLSYIKITHEPTGESVSLPFRDNEMSESKARKLALKLLTSRIYAKRMQLHEAVKTYELPDGIQYPDELLYFKT